MQWNNPIPKMKILSIRPKQGAVYTYRSTRPLGRLKTTFRKTILRKNDKLKISELADRFKRIGDIWQIKYIDDFHTLDVLYTMRNHSGAKIVVDIDDNVWEMPLNNAAISKSPGEYSAHSRRCVNTLESIRSADWVTVSTIPLKNKLRRINHKINVLPNLIDEKQWKPSKKENDKIKIGWIYSPTHIPDIAEVKNAIKGIYNKYKDKIEIVLFGSELDVFEVPTTHVKGVSFDKYPEKLCDLNLDISIAPLAGNEFNKCKSNIKWMESTLSGAAFIGSDVYPYKTSIKNGETGMIAKSKRDWFSKLSSLIENEQKRKELVENAKKEVIKNYSINTNDVWEKFYSSL